MPELSSYVHGVPLPLSALPSSLLAGQAEMKQLYYQGFWLPEALAAGAVPLQQRFEPRPDDVIVASLPKCGTTWVNALAFAVMARRTYNPLTAADHPLLRLSPHECVPFLEGLFSPGHEARLDALPSPRLMNTHMPLAFLPRCGGCRVVYVCREPKDMAVSLFHYVRKLCPEVTFPATLDSVCNGDSWYGPFWEHVLGYWRASRGDSAVLFLRYEELLRDPARELRRLARFVGQPFSRAEEDAGVVLGIVQLCSLESLRGLEDSRSAGGGVVDPRLKIPRTALYRKGVAGDWRNHMTPEMARRMDGIVADRFAASGLAFD